MDPQSSHAMQYFTHVYLHAETPVDAGYICTWWTKVILITEKPEDPNLSHIPR